MEMGNAPLADRLRPKSLDDVIGQDEAVGNGSLLRTITENNQPTSLILWGPPGTGKTTIARILSEAWDAETVELSAVTSGVKEVRQVVEEARQNQRLQRRTVLFVDEIHRFNKSQQDGFLPHVESGLITLIGATTENPSFEINNALLSRMQVVVLNSLSEEALEDLAEKAAKELKVKISKQAKKIAAQFSGGDGRVVINTVEVARGLRKSKAQIAPDHIKQALQRINYQFDKAGEEHYNLISALIKSMRGSATKPALYYLHRLIAGGEDPIFIARRLVIFASEDIGMKAPYALTLAVAAFQAVERVGLPEGEYALTHAVMALSESEKSRGVADAMSEAKNLVKNYPNAKVPLALRNAPTKLMKDLGYNQGYKWQADFKPGEGFWPDEIKKG